MRDKIFTLIGVLLGNVGLALAWNPPDYSLTLDADTRAVAVSTGVAAPTRLLIKDTGIQRNYIVNTTTATIYISSTTAGISAANAFGIPGVGTVGNAPVIWSPDGVASPFAGDLYGVANTNTQPTIYIFRSK